MFKPVMPAQGGQLPAVNEEIPLRYGRGSDREAAVSLLIRNSAMFYHSSIGGKAIRVAGVLAGGFLLQIASAQSAAPAKPATAAAPFRYRPSVPHRAQMFYEGAWGVDSFSVKWAESGEMVRFSWRVTDPEKAKPLNDKKLEPSLEDPQAGVSLVVPVLEKVGQLRQAVQNIEAGKSYWMGFSNVGRRVKRGDRVNVVIGNFRAEGLVVE